jgi:hypothetical protein
MSDSWKVVAFLPLSSDVLAVFGLAVFGFRFFLFTAPD